jgi:hypothetical protein
VRRLPLEWDHCCDDDGNSYELRKVVEPTPVFAGGRLYYVVSVVPDPYYLETPEPVDETVVVDAARARVVGEYDHADPDADRRLRAFFDRAAEAPAAG